MSPLIPSASKQRFVIIDPAAEIDLQPPAWCSQVLTSSSHLLLRRSFFRKPGWPLVWLASADWDALLLAKQGLWPAAVLTNTIEVVSLRSSGV